MEFVNKNKIKDKKGFLLAEETLKIIIALICIIFLVYLLSSLYNSHIADKKLNQAKEVLVGFESEVPSIEKVISFLPDGETEVKIIYEPKGWFLYGFTKQEKPNSCLNQNCICLCKPVLIGGSNSQIKKCDKKGACLIIPGLLDSEINWKIEGGKIPLFIEITKQDGRFFIGR